MNDTKRIILLGWTLAVLIPLSAQNLSLQDCLESARATSPIRDLQAQTGRSFLLQDEILANAWKPTASLNAQGTYQSDVITFPENTPLGNLPALPQAQVRATIDLQQTVYDGGAIGAGRRVTGSRRNMMMQEFDISLAETDRQITTLYFGILEAQANQRLLENTQAYLRRQKPVIESGIAAGILLPAELDRMEQELLRLQQNIELISGQAGAMQASLAVMVGVPEVTEMTLQTPAIAQFEPVTRPEYEQFELRKAVIHAQTDQLGTTLAPKVAAFMTGGFGQPNPYNFLETSFSGFYMVGLRLSWAPFDWGSTQKQRELNRIQLQNIDEQKALFDIRNAGQRASLQQQVTTLNQVAETDQRIISLQESVLRTAENQLANGTMTLTEYLKEVQTLTQYRLSAELHQLQIISLSIQLSQL